LAAKISASTNHHKSGVHSATLIDRDRIGKKLDYYYILETKILKKLLTVSKYQACYC